MNKYAQRFAPYLVAAVLSVVMLFFSLKLWQADWRIPFHYRILDATYSLTVVKCTIENGWYLRNPLLGAPSSAQSYDFPRTDHFHILIIKLIALFTDNYAIAANVFYALSFVLITISSLYVLRHFGMSASTAIVCSLLYSFLPYHFGRGQSHLFLSAYYMIPLIVLVALGICLDSAWNRKQWFSAVIVAVLVASSGIYYTFFAALLIFVSGVLGMFRHKTGKPLLQGVTICAILFVTFLANLIPNFIYWKSHGKNPAAIVRNFQMTESYGLKLSNLFLPFEHRIPALTRFTSEYYRGAEGLNERRWSYLGIVGASGFVTLLGIIFVQRMIASPLFQSLSQLNLAAVLIGTAGGFGTMLNYISSSPIRCFNRLSIFIAFLSLFAVGFLLDKLRVKRTIYLPALISLLVIGFLDQTVPENAVYRKDTYEQHATDRKFVQTLEQKLPPSAMIFQLPYIAYPEGHHPSIAPYDHLDNYLHSHKLHWSFGAIKGRQTDRWQYELAKTKPIAQMIPVLKQSGFHAIYIDRKGFESSHLAVIEKTLRILLQTEPIVSEDGRRMVFVF